MVDFSINSPWPIPGPYFWVEEVSVGDSHSRGHLITGRSQKSGPQSGTKPWTPCHAPFFSIYPMVFVSKRHTYYHIYIYNQVLQLQTPSETAWFEVVVVFASKHCISETCSCHGASFAAVIGCWPMAPWTNMGELPQLDPFNWTCWSWDFVYIFSEPGPWKYTQKW